MNIRMNVHPRLPQFMWQRFWSVSLILMVKHGDTKNNNIGLTPEKWNQPLSFDGFFCLLSGAYLYITLLTFPSAFLMMLMPF